MPLSNLSYIKNRLAKNIAKGGSLVVTLSTVTGGTLNASTGAFVGGTETVYSGTMQALAIEEVPRSVLRQYQEIQAGDLIVDCQANPQVCIYPGQPQSGMLSLSGLAQAGLQFQFNGRLYVQAQIGEDLADIWALTVEGVQLMGGLLLRRQT